MHCSDLSKWFNLHANFLKIFLFLTTDFRTGGFSIPHYAIGFELIQKNAPPFS